MTHIGRISPSSPPSPQLSSSTTSTLISTPPLKAVVEPRRMSLLKTLVLPATIEDSDRGESKARGNLEPHITNIPRRRKKNTKPTQAQAYTQTSPNKGDPLPLPPQAQSHNKDFSVPPETDAKQGNVQPSLLNGNHDQLSEFVLKAPTRPLANLPRRRRKALTSEQLVIQRAYRRCLQEIGEGSGVFVAFTEVDDEEEQDTGKLRRLGGEDFTYIVRACVADNSSEDKMPGKIWKEDEHTLWLYVPSDICHDDGNTHLEEQQLQFACRFLLQGSSTAKVLITTPRDRAADAMSLAVIYLAVSKRFVPPRTIFIEPPAAATVTPHPSYLLCRAISTSSTLSQNPEADSRIHALLIYLHDQSCDDLEEAYGHVLSAAKARSSAAGVVTSGWKMGSGLRMEWRGTLSREGIDFLDEVLEVLHADIDSYSEQHEHVI